MRRKLLYIAILAGVLANALGQTSSLVYPGTNGTLVYEKYANQGEDTLVNIIPDYSFAGYMGGGVSLPDNIPIKVTLEPTGSEDDRAMIQDAINTVSALPMDDNGIRGAVYLKKGLYKVNGSLYINGGGVILQGERQQPANKGGTELVATQESQHTFITVKGIKTQIEVENPINTGTDLASFSYPAIDEKIVGDVTAGIEHEFSVDSIITIVLYTIEGGNFKIYSKEALDSTKIPFLEIIAYSEQKMANDTLKIYPSDDTYVRALEELQLDPPANYKDTIYGNDDIVFYKKIDPEVARIGFLKFDFTTVSGSIVSATLNMVASRIDQSGMNYISYSTDDNWSEDTRTWNTTFGNTNPEKRIITHYVGTGASSFVVEDASSFKPGDKIFVRRTPNQLWCDTLLMSTLSSIDPETTDWTPSSYTIEHPRIITAIRGDTIIIDIPIVDPMQDLYGGGEILKNTFSTNVQNSAIENMYISSIYKNDDDEEHGWEAIVIKNASNCWVRNVTARYFGYACVDIQDDASYCTIEDCALLDPKSLTEGGRKYPFPIHGGIGNLVQRCYARGGRHSFATHSRLTGPHVFLDCYATETYADVGPHHRWAAGILYDNVYGGQIRAQNRWDMGSGHGWAGVQNMFWNCYSYRENFKIESPLGGRNWGIGCDGQVQEGDGFWESYGTPVQPRSLYLQQLEDRLGIQAVLNTTTEEQQIGNLWDQLAEWAGAESTSELDPVETMPFVKVYPNPSDGTLYIDLMEVEGDVHIEIFDIQGKTILIERLYGGDLSRIELPDDLTSQLVFIKISKKDTVVFEKVLIN